MPPFVAPNRLENVLRFAACPDCQGARLRPEALVKGVQAAIAPTARASSIAGSGLISDPSG